MSSSPRSPLGSPTVAVCLLVLSLTISPLLAQEKKEDQKVKTEKEKPVRITEEIQVVGKAPKDLPLATVSTVLSEDIAALKPRDLSDILKFIPGSLVTFGDKDTYTLKLRGVGANRIALLVDGVPNYEPYFSTFDLKTIPAGSIDTVQVTKGPSSVLYGPNTLGGLVNVITRRPSAGPSLTLTGSYGDRDTKGLGANGSASFGRFSLAGDVRYQGSDGFNYPDQASGARLPRANSDFERLNLTAKAYYTPSSSTEIMVNGGLYRSSYGMPPALFTQRARYWRFPKWDRSTLNAGGFTSLGRNSILRFRSFYVSYDNTLDWFADPAMTELDSSSTYDNSSYGGFALAELPNGGRNTLKTSLLYQRDVARIQDDAGLPWDRFDQGTLSAGVEDHLSLAGAWKIIGGLSLDSIDKYRGGANNTALNPLVGLKFTPNQDLDLHVSFARKSRFPSMRSLYSPSSGNPDLLAESGTAVEAAGTWNGPVFFTASVFFNKFRNFIDTVRNPDGTRTYYNVGRAHINGFEVQVQKATRRAAATANYTFLDHRNETDDRPLDAQPKHNLNLEAAVTPFSGVRLGLYGLYGSTSWWYDSSSRTVLTIPSFFSLDAVLGYTIRGRYEIFARLGNLFDDYFYTEPGFPWRGRYFELGFRADVLK